MNNRTHFIYALIDPRTDTVRYVGKTVNPTRRLQSHITRRKTLKTHCASWINSLVEQGIRPKLAVLEEKTELDWQDAEKKWIKHYRDLGIDLTNFTEGGDTSCASYGRLGKKNSPEHIKKTADARRGKPVKRSPESNARRREGLRRYHERTAVPVYQYEITGEFVREWKSAVEAGQELNISYSDITRCCKKNEHSSAGYQWRYEKHENVGKFVRKEPWNKGKPMADELRNKVSSSKKGKPWTEARRLAQQKRKETEHSI